MMRKPLKSCANGCGVPPAPPSLVICKPCTEKVGQTLRMLADGAPTEDLLRHEAAHEARIRESAARSREGKP